MKQGRPLIDLTGRCFGRWEVLRQADVVSSNGEVLWLCRCRGCGRTRMVRGYNLRHGRTRQCLNCHNAQQSDPWAWSRRA